MPNIVFSVSLTATDWNPEKGGWVCEALKLPGADVSEVYAKGDRLGPDDYDVLADQNLVRWRGRDHRPESMAVTIHMNEDLSLSSDTTFWKRMAVVGGPMATIAAAIIATFAPYHAANNTRPPATTSTPSKTQPSLTQEVQPSTTKSLLPTSPRPYSQPAARPPASASVEDNPPNAARNQWIATNFQPSPESPCILDGCYEVPVREAPTKEAAESERRTLEGQHPNIGFRIYPWPSGDKWAVVVAMGITQDEAKKMQSQLQKEQNLHVDYHTGRDFSVK